MRKYWEALIVCVLLAAASLPGLLWHESLSTTTEALVYVLAVVVAAHLVGRAAAIACAFAAVTLFNFLFIDPRFTLNVDAQENAAALVVMLTVAIAVSQLTADLRKQTAAARQSEHRARQLQALATDLAACTLAAEVYVLGQKHLGRAFSGATVAPWFGPQKGLGLREGTPPEVADGLNAALRERAMLGPGTGRWPELPAWYLPLEGHGHALGAAYVPGAREEDESGREHALAICTLVGQALGRLEMAQAARAAEESSHWHRARSSFLTAISHDFRTPLAVVTGAASSLDTQAGKLPPEERTRLLHVILEEARHLTAITENTLQLVRLEDAGELQFDWQSMEEIAGSVLARVRQRDPARRIQASVDAGLPLAKGDPVLLAQLLENLLDNALKHTAGPIELAVHAGDGWMQAEVRDRGDFVESPAGPGDHRAGRTRGGMGLALCRAIAQAHGGEIARRPRIGGGSTFTLRLPLEADQPQAEASPA